MDKDLIKFAGIERGTSKKSGKPSVAGECIYLDVKFVFHINAIKRKDDKEYLLTVTVISPETKKILQSTKKLKKLEKDGKITKKDRDKIAAGKSLEKLNAETSTYLRATDIKTDKQVRAKVAPLVINLYGDHQEDLFKALKMPADICGYNARTAYEMHQSAYFLRRGTVAKNTLQNNKKLLKTFCDHLAHKPISLLTNADVAHAVKAISKSNRTKTVNLAEEFFRYCGEIGVYSGKNPVESYKSSLGGGKADAGGRMYPFASSHLVEAAEVSLHNMIADNLMDPMSLAIPLVKGFRITIARLLEITWADILIDGSEVRIQDYKDNFLGGTHNYIRPPLRETADFIIAKYHTMRKEYGITKLKKMRVVPILADDAPVAKKKAELSKYFLQTLRAVGVTDDDLKRAKSPTETSKAAGGAGYIFLCKHYDHVLQERCGVKLDSGIGCYLRGVRIYDTTTDFYRALSDATGNHILQVIMGRDDMFTRKDDSAAFELTSTPVDGGREIIVPPAPPGTRAAVITKKVIFIPKGGTLVVRGAVEGTVRCRKDPETLFADKKVILH